MFIRLSPVQRWSHALCAAGLACALGSVSAHGLRISLQPDAQGVHGRALLGADAPAAGAVVTVEPLAATESAGHPPAMPPSAAGPSERPRALRLQSDAGGRFQWSGESGRRYRVVVETRDGHRAQAYIAWTAPGSSPAAAMVAAVPRETALAGQATMSAGAGEPPVLAPLVAKAVATAVRDELRPMREDLARLEARTRLAELVGGVGLIAGAAGMWAWWRARPRSVAASPQQGSVAVAPQQGSVAVAPQQGSVAASPRGTA